MNKILLVTLLFFSISCYSKDIDSTIFENKFEKNLFLKILNNQKYDTIDLFIALNFNDTYKVLPVNNNAAF